MADDRASDSFDWSHIDSLTDEQILAAALADPDAQPSTDEQLARMRPAPMARWIRMRMKLSQEAFAERFRIPIGTLRDWEQGRKVPDAATRAYLTVIAQDPEAVLRALEAPLKSPRIQDDHQLGSSSQSAR